jgi:hypothetical protein
MDDGQNRKPLWFVGEIPLMRNPREFFKRIHKAVVGN